MNKREGWPIGWIIVGILVLVWVLASPSSGKIDDTGPIEVCANPAYC